MEEGVGVAHSRHPGRSQKNVNSSSRTTSPRIDSHAADARGRQRTPPEEKRTDRSSGYVGYVG